MHNNSRSSDQIVDHQDRVSGKAPSLTITKNILAHSLINYKPINGKHQSDQFVSLEADKTVISRLVLARALFAEESPKHFEAT